jgi:hypothetical protein
MLGIEPVTLFMNTIKIAPSCNPSFHPCHKRTPGYRTFDRNRKAGQVTKTATFVLVFLTERMWDATHVQSQI